MKAVLFDLDDTLYPEREFVRGGFARVAERLARETGVAAPRLRDELLAVLARDGRGRVLDTVLERLGLRSDERIAILLHLYRTHVPSLRPFDDVPPALARLRREGLRLGILTDGMASVQHRKLAALGLEPAVDAVVCSDELGPGCSKPAAAPYRALLALLDVAPAEACYVGNDLTKDFVWPNAAGMLSVEVRRPGTPDGAAAVPASHRAQVVVAALDELVPLVLARSHAR